VSSSGAFHFILGRRRGGGGADLTKNHLRRESGVKDPKQPDD